MLNFYIGSENLPKDMPLVTNIDLEFKLVWLRGYDIEKSLIAEIEKGKYENTQMWFNRFGIKCYPDYLSTGTKTAICAYAEENKVFYGGGIGENVLDLIFREGHGNFYYKSKLDILLNEDVIDLRTDITVNGESCDYSRLLEVLVW